MEIRKAIPGVVWVIDDEYAQSFTIAELADLLDVTPQTINRWARGDPLPGTLRLALRYVIGLLAHPRWAQFRVAEDGRLHAPNGFAFHPGELEYIGLVRQHNRVLKQRLQELEQLREDASEPVVQGSALGAKGAV